MPPSPRAPVGPNYGNHSRHDVRAVTPPPVFFTLAGTSAPLCPVVIFVALPPFGLVWFLGPRLRGQTHTARPWARSVVPRQPHEAILRHTGCAHRAAASGAHLPDRWAPVDCARHTWPCLPFQGAQRDTRNLLASPILRASRHVPNPRTLSCQSLQVIARDTCKFWVFFTFPFQSRAECYV